MRHSSQRTEYDMNHCLLHCHGVKREDMIIPNKCQKPLLPLMRSAENKRELDLSLAKADTVTGPQANGIIKRTERDRTAGPEDQSADKP